MFIMYNRFNRNFSIKGQNMGTVSGSSNKLSIVKNMRKCFIDITGKEI